MADDGSWDHEYVTDEETARRLAATQRRRVATGLVVLVVVLGAVGTWVALQLFASPVVGTLVVLVVLAAAVGSWARTSRQQAVRSLPPGTVLRTRFDDQGFETERSGGFADRVPWSGVTALQLDDRHGMVTWRAGDQAVAWTLPVEVFPEEQVGRWQERQRQGVGDPGAQDG